jgi:tRNA A-37 threonylcarbamoyl transferase component Bud32
MTDDSVRIPRVRKKRMRALSMLYKMYPLTTRGAIRYALHSFANRAGFGFKTKPIPKLRITEKVVSTVELDRPNKLLRLDEGVVFEDATKMVGEIARMSGFETYEYEEKKKGDYINSSKQLEIWGDGRRMKFILKQFPELKSVKWVFLNLWSLVAKKFNMSPLSRLDREVEAARRLRELGIKTHRITGIILDERTLVTEYTEGVPLDKSIEEITTGKSTDTSNVKEYAQILGKLHKAGLVYGDTKPQNVLVGKDGIVLLDLEQAVERGDKAWDLAEFLYYSAKLAKQDEGMKLIAESFLAAYRTENGSQVIRKARNIRYLSPFMLVLAPKMTWMVRKALASYASPDDPRR